MAILPKFYGQKNKDVIGFLKELEHFIGGLVKGEGVTDDDLKMKVCPLCLANTARQWMNGLDKGSLITWPEVYSEFMRKYYPQSKTTSIRQQISNFDQLRDESLYEAWDRFRSLLAQCPHHRYSRGDLNQYFYDGLSENQQSFIDASCRGGMMELTVASLREKFATLARNNQHRNPKRNGRDQRGEANADFNEEQGENRK